MRTFFTDLWVQLKGIWARLDGSQRLVVGAVLTAAVVGLGAMLWFANRPSYEVVFSADSAEDLKEARRILSQEGIAFVPSDSGMDILVERGRVGQANAALAGGNLRGSSAGSPSSGIASVMEDSDTRAANLDDKRRGQAEAAVRTLEGVLQVTVSAFKPKRASAFRDRDEENKPRATVALKLRPGTPFDAVARNAASIASSQLGVPLQNVEVCETATLQRWSWDPEREAGGGASEFLSLVKAMSQGRTQTAQARLDAVYPGRTIVTVNVELDPSWEIRTEKILPEQKLVKSDDTTKDETRTPRAADASTGPAAEPPPAEGPTTSKETRKLEFVTEQLIGERKVGRQFPEVKRLTATLLYDKALEQQQGFDKNVFEQTVKTLVGIDPARVDADGNPADTFSALATPWPEATPEPLASGPGLGDQALRWAPAVGQVLGVLLVLLFLRSLFRRSRPATAAADQEPTAEELSPDEQARRMRREIEKSIATDPAALAKLLESWLAEQKV